MAEPTAMAAVPELLPPVVKPRLLLMHAALPCGAFVTTDRASVYFLEVQDAWAAMSGLMDPRLDQLPQGNT